MAWRAIVTGMVFLLMVAGGIIFTVGGSVAIVGIGEWLRYEFNVALAGGSECSEKRRVAVKQVLPGFYPTGRATPYACNKARTDFLPRVRASSAYQAVVASGCPEWDPCSEDW